MLSNRTRTLASASVAALVILGSASSAFAIRNRYTNQQAQGFGAYLFGDYGRYGYAEDGYDVVEGPAYGPYGYDRPYRPHGRRRPIYGYDE